MTTISLIRKDGHYRGFIFDGHADYCDDQPDIVCAALSITSISTVNSLQILLGLTPLVKQDEARAYLSCQLTAEMTEAMLEKSDLLIGHLSVAVMDLAEIYPKHVKVYTREVLEDD